MGLKSAGENRTPANNRGDRSGWNEEIHGDRSGQLANSTVLQISWINDRQERRRQQRRGEQSSKGMVEMERSEWSDLRQESTNEIEDPDIPDSDSTDAAVRL